MILYDLIINTAQTLYMVIISTICASLLGLPLGTILFISKTIRPQPWLSNVLDKIINFSRSVPFIILFVALIPLTRLIVGTSIGINAALVPLTLGATPLVARLVDNALLTLPLGLRETGFSLGASTWQIIRFILLPEALPAIMHAIIVTAITLVNYSAMAGVIGGGGLGDLAIRYGYQRFNIGVMLITIAILVLIVHAIQTLGDRLAQHFAH